MAHHVVLFVHMLFILPMTLSIPNCIIENATECVKCQEGYVLDSKNCFQCLDINCSSCLKPSMHSCIQCKAGFTLVNKQCGLSCDSVPNCELCSSNPQHCIFCRGGCKVTEGKCSCASKVVSIIVCIIISLIVVIVVAFCLTNTSSSRRNKFVQLALSATTNESDIIQNFSNSRIIVDPLGLQLGQEQSISAKSKTKTKKKNMEPQQLSIITTDSDLTKSIDEEKSLCDYCLVEVAIERLSCGCNLCCRHHTLIKTENDKCPICHKEVIDIEVLRCGMCGQGLKDFKQLSCQCKLQVCVNCFKLQEGKDSKCPNCI